MKPTIVPIQAAMAFGPAFTGCVLPGYDASLARTPFHVDIDPEYRFDNIDAFRRLAWAQQREHTRAEYRHRRGLHIFGPQGCGKTSLIEQFYARLNIPLIRATWNPKREAEEMISGQTLQDGDLLPVDKAVTIAAMNGWPLLINEFDLADPAEAVGLNDVFEKGLITLPDGTIKKAQRGFMCHITTNSTGLEDEMGTAAGTRTQNHSTMRRFFPCRMGYASEEQERDWLVAQCPSASVEICGSVAKVATKIRQAFEGTADGQRLDITIARPQLLDWLEMQHGMQHLSAQGVNVALYTLVASYGDHLPKEQHKVLEQIIDGVYRSP